VNKILAEDYLNHFIKQAWHIVEPKNDLIWGWHLDAICEHLMAVTNHQIQNLIINIPPRHTKSISASVMWPAWEWTKRPETRWLYSSYAEALSIRDSRKCRNVIQSNWYQQRWGDKFEIVTDQNQKVRFDNDKTGYRIATSVGGVGTGEGGSRIVSDDPHNIKEAESEAVRGGTILWWDESMSTRLDNPKTGSKVIIMQRTHEADLSGHVLEKEIGYVHLCLPARYELERKKLFTKTPLSFKDPRTKEGEPLCPERYGEKELEKLEKELGTYATAGQLQQRPHPRGGGLFEVANFVLVHALPPAVSSVRYWDKAGTEGGGARTAGVLFLKFADGTFGVSDVVKGQWAAPKRERMIKQTAELDGPNVVIWVEQEPGSGGKESAESTVLNLAGFKIHTERATGAKEVRAEPYAVQVEAGNVKVLIADWTKDFINEHEKAPTGKFKDQWDAAAGAFNKLVRTKRAGTW